MMKISPKGVLEIAEHEGIVLGPYLDSVNVWTYGVGHTAMAGAPDPSKMKRENTKTWSKDRVFQELASALDLFDKDLDRYEERVRKAVKVPLKQHQFDALVSFDFNTGGIYKANLTKDLNKGDYSGEGFMGWVRPKEIIKRRKAEQSLFQTGDYEANGSFIPVYDVDEKGKVKFRFSLTSKDLEGLMGNRATVTNKGIMGIFLGWAKNFFKRA